MSTFQQWIYGLCLFYSTLASTPFSTSNFLLDSRHSFLFHHSLPPSLGGVPIIYSKYCVILAFTIYTYTCNMQIGIQNMSY